MKSETASPGLNSMERREASLPGPAGGKVRVNFWTRRRPTPTYEVVGKVERYDPRDNLGNRAALVPGTERYRAYYREHPDWEDGDKSLRIFPTPEARERRREALFGKEPLALALSNACKLAYRLPGVNNEPVSEKRVELDPQLAARNIKGVARYLGADLVGICELNPAWVYSHSAEETDGLHWGDPIHLSHRYAIVILVAHNFEMLLSGRGTGLTPTIETNDVAFAKVIVPGIRLASYIRALGYPAEAHFMGGKVNSVPVAADAGLGEVGRNGLLITREYGPAVRINVVTTDLPLAVDKPVDIGVQDFCAKCFKCADTCSSGSIPRGDKEVVNGIRLWSVNNDLCYRLRASQGSEPVCFNCLSACPWTKPHNAVHQSAAWLAARSGVARRALIWVDDVLYGRIPRQHPFPAWLEWDNTQRSLKKRISILLHKI